MIKYALHKVSGKPVFIRDAKRGLPCNCICFACKRNMIAVQPKEESNRAWFYRHQAYSTCSGGPELAIHALSKKFILDNTSISTHRGQLNYFNAVAEKGIDGLIPDVTVSTEEGIIHFEIEVTNPVNQYKKDKYKSGQHRCIAIDLSKVDREINPEDLKRLVLEEITNKRTIFWEVEEEVAIVPSANSSNEFWEKFILVAIIFFVFRGLSRLRF